MKERTFVALDLETTGLDANRDQIIEIGAVRFQYGRIIEQFSTLVNPGRAIPLRVQQITGIRNGDVAQAPPLAEVVPELLAFVDRDVAAVVAHNAQFDLAFLRAAGVEFHRPALDTFELATILLPESTEYSLGELCRVEEIELNDAHRALDDALATAHLFMRLWERTMALPASVHRHILESSRYLENEVDWPPLMLFDDAARELAAYESAQRTGARSYPVVSPQQSDTFSPELTQDQPLSREELERAEPLGDWEEAVAGFFAETGPLAAQMGAGYEARAGQLDMAQRVMQALARGEHLLIEAGTGTGKSLAYLVPAALWSLVHNRRVVIATNTIALQNQLMDKDLAQVRDLLAAYLAEQYPAAGEMPALRFADLKGRSNYVCLRRLHGWRTGHALSPLELRVLAKVLVWLCTTVTGDMQELFLPGEGEQAISRYLSADSAACTLERCDACMRGDVPGTEPYDFYLAARQRAAAAHIIVVNHALLLADIKNGGGVLPPYSHLIIDEAHHLENAATDQLTYRASWRSAHTLLNRLSASGPLLQSIQQAADPELAEALQPLLARLHDHASAAHSTLDDFAKRLHTFVVNQREIRTRTGYTQRLHLSDAIRTQPRWSQVEIEWDAASERLGGIVGQLGRVIERLERAKWWQQEPQSTLLNEVQGMHTRLDEWYRTLDDVILTGPQETPGSALGALGDVVAWFEVNDEADHVDILAAPLSVNRLLEGSLVRAKRSVILTGATLRTGSGFDYLKDRLGLWDVPDATVSSPFDYSRSTLLYMPSDMPAPEHPNYQSAVERAIIAAATATGGRTLALFTSYAHLRATADAIRNPLDRLGITVLQQGGSGRRRLLREYRQSERAVLLGTRTFWEGIDLPGDELLSLLIVRLPFAVPNDPLVAARSVDYDNAFADYTLPDAILRFRQGFGRLIRSTQDRGTVVLLDSRLWQRSYGQSFLDALPPCTECRAPLSNLQSEIELWMDARE